MRRRSASGSGTESPPHRPLLSRADSLLDSYPHLVERVDAESAARLWRSVPGLRAGALLVGPHLFVYPDVPARCVAAALHQPLSRDDVWLVGLPGCGATLLQEMVWLIAHDCDPVSARSELVPVRWEYLELTHECLESQELVNTLWWDMVKESVFNLPRMLLAAARRAWYRHHHSPRFVKTHMALSMLPPRLLDECRVIYVARNPKDALVSYYHQHKLFRTHGFDGTFEEFFDLFLENKLMQLPFFPHVHQAWEKRLHPNLLFVFFEEMEMNLKVVIRRVANFLRKDLSDEDVDALHSQLQFDAMSENPYVQLHWLRETGLMSDAQSLFRRGRTGDWKNYFTPTMDARMTAWMEENLRGSDLRFITELERRD